LRQLVLILVFILILYRILGVMLSK